MAYEKIGATSLNYQPCRYPGSKLMFRGPAKPLDGKHVVFLGGTDTYGKFITRPYPDRIEKQIGMTCINMGWPNAGIDVFLHDTGVLDACQKARAVVLQVPCASNMSNRLYSVHPRRNDRFLGPSKLMQEIFRDVDFTEFHFTRHMLSSLQERAPDRFKLVLDELQQAWIARVGLLATKVSSPLIYLWFSARRPSQDNDSAEIALDPAFVTREMLEAVRYHATAFVEVRASAAAQALGTQGMVYSELEEAAARELLGPMAHEEVARVLSPVLRDIIS